MQLYSAAIRGNLRIFLSLFRLSGYFVALFAVAIKP